MNRYTLRTALLCAALSPASLLPAFSQTAEPAAPPAKEAAVTLPTFEITADSANPYQSNQALSASRVAMSIQDIPQTLSVVPRELIEDTLGSRMLDVAKYVTPVVESTLPFGGDRYTIRGFQVSQEFIDGTNISGADGYSMSLAPYNVERIEVIKGPNAILVPGGSPGGVMNPITKSPGAKNFATLNIEYAEYMGNSVNFDVNRVLSKDGRMAARLVVAYWENDLYFKNQYRNGYMIAPSFSYQLSPMHKLTIKSETVQNRETNFGGVPLDPNIGTDGFARTVTSLPRDWSFGNETDSRHRETNRVSAELLSTFNDHITSRLYLMGDMVHRRDVGGTSAAITAATAGGGSRNPFTGKWEPGVNYAVNNSGANAVVTSTFVPVGQAENFIFSRTNGLVNLHYDELHLKNDYAARYEWDWLKSTTIAGLAANTSKVHFVSLIPAARSPVAANNLGAITYEAYNFGSPRPGLTTAGLGTDMTAKQNDLQFFLYETLSAWDDRIQVSGGVSRFFGELTRTDTTGTAINPALLQTAPSYNLSDTAESFGVVIKPIKEVSLFYGYNSTGGTMPGSLSAGANAPSLKVASGSQNEYGVKTALFDNRFTASFAYFDIVQENYPVPNSEYYNLVAQGRLAEASALQNPLYLNLNSKGWEVEFSYSLNKNLTVLANYTDFKVRQPITNVRVRGVPDQAGGIYVDYRFTEGVVKGFGINVGADYKSSVAGDNATGYTTTAPLTGTTPFVANQPSFYVDGRTLVNLGLSYRRDNYTVRFTITNLFDKDYILAAGSRTSVINGEPMSFKSSFSYKF